LSATSETISAISNAMFSRSVTTDCTARAPTTWRRVVWARSMRALRRSLMPKAERYGLLIW
jgi:hypothetical protein